MKIKFTDVDKSDLAYDLRRTNWHSPWREKINWYKNMKKTIIFFGLRRGAFINSIAEIINILVQELRDKIES